jgi:hypothetical protein
MKRSMWMLIFLFLIVLGVFFFIKYREENETTAVPTSDKLYLFNFDEQKGKITNIRIQDSDNYIFLKRDANEQWQIEEPFSSPADQGTVTMAETQIYALSVKSIVENVQDVEVFGFNSPKYIFEIGFSNGEMGKFEVGEKTPTETGYYVRMDNKVYIVFQYNIDALANLLTSPPYLETPTPIPPTATPTPLVIDTITPELLTPTSTP